MNVDTKEEPGEESKEEVVVDKRKQLMEQLTASTVTSM